MMQPMHGSTLIPNGIGKEGNGIYQQPNETVPAHRRVECLTSQGVGNHWKMQKRMWEAGKWKKQAPSQVHTNHVNPEIEQKEIEWRAPHRHSLK